MFSKSKTILKITVCGSVFAIVAACAQPVTQQIQFCDLDIENLPPAVITQIRNDPNYDSNLVIWFEQCPDVALAFADLATASIDPAPGVHGNGDTSSGGTGFDDDGSQSGDDNGSNGDGTDDSGGIGNGGDGDDNSGGDNDDGSGGFTPPGQGAAVPNTNGNNTPGNGGTPPGHQDRE